MGRSSKTNPLSAMGLDHAITPPGGDPDYIMQLVNDVRKFSDVLLSLKEAFQSKGGVLFRLAVSSAAFQAQVLNNCGGNTFNKILFVNIT